MGQAKFQIFKGKNGEYYFNLKSSNGQVILKSEGYESKGGCKNGIASVKENAPDDSRYIREESKDGQYYFNLLAGNGEIIGTSETYSTAGNRDEGIEAVKKAAPDAPIEETAG